MSNKFKMGAHYCKTPILGMRNGRTWRCRKCGAVYRCKETKGRLVWLLIKDGRK